VSRVNLLGGTYLARSIIASAQVCQNLFPEKNPQDAAAPYTHYLTPGSTLLGVPPLPATARALYTATNGSLYYVCGNNVYLVALGPPISFTLLGALGDNLTTPVGINDNGNVLIIVNGTGVPIGGTGPGAGWAINLQPGIAGQPIAGVVTNAGTSGAGGSVNAGTITSPGSGALNGTYSGVEFTGGSGTGGTATSVTVTNLITGFAYVSQQQVTSQTWEISTAVPHGLVGGGQTVTIAGCSSVNFNGTFLISSINDTYSFNISGVPTFRGTVGAPFGVIIASGTGGVTSVTPSGDGSGYDAGDTLGLDLAGLSGFVYTVAAYGIGVVNGTYSDVALSGGSGSGAQGSFLVTGGVVTDFTITSGQGTGYRVGDVLSTSLVPGLAGFQLQLTVVGAAQNAFAAIVDPNFLGGTAVGTLDTFMVMNQPGTRNWFSSLSGITYDQLTGVPGQPLFGVILAAGTGGTAGTYNAVPLVNGSGIGASANIVVEDGVITSVTLTAGGTGYSIAPAVSVSGGGGSGAIIIASVNASGAVVALDLIDGGSGYSSPTVAFSGGGGSDAAATAIATDGAVSSVQLLPTGLTYNAGDILIAQTTKVPTNFQYELVEVNAPAFDPTYVASKTGYPDTIATLVVLHREIWLLGNYVSAEVWLDSGGEAFPFSIMPGVFIQHGCMAPYSVATHDLVTFWLGIDSAGLGTVFMGAGYSARRISTFAIEQMLAALLKSSGTLSDAIGMVYKQQDHVFYILTFPTADATFVFDLTEGLWHTRTWTDPATGNQHRIRANCMALSGNTNVSADWQTGALYALDMTVATDNGGPIVRQRGFPHLINDGKRVTYDALRLDIQCGAGIAASPTQQPLLKLEYSDDRGATFTPAPYQSLGAQGNYLVQPLWRNLGLARDRVFRVTWSDPAFTALQGAWLDVTQSET
jgi:hypothetical protein